MKKVIGVTVNDVQLILNRDENYMIYNDAENKVKYKFYDPITIGNKIKPIFTVFFNQLKLGNKEYYKKYLSGHFCSNLNLNLVEVEVTIKYDEV